MEENYELKTAICEEAKMDLKAAESTEEIMDLKETECDNKKDLSASDFEQKADKGNWCKRFVKKLLGTHWFYLV